MTWITRQEHWEPEKSMTRWTGERLCGLPYSEELAGPDGMHFHVWFPGTPTQERLREVRDAIAADRDLVSMSWDIEPPGYQWNPDGAKSANVVALRKGVEEKSMVTLKWDDGRVLSVDLFSASAIVQVYDALNEENRAKFAALIGKGPAGVARAVEIAFSVMK